MAQSETKLVTPGSLLVDALLVGGFFAFMFWYLQPHVPSKNPFQIYLWSGLTASCMSGVFWLAVQMFRVVYRAQKGTL